jgi:hypothetical protein
MELISDQSFGKNAGMCFALSCEILSITGIAIHETGKPGKGAPLQIIVSKSA